MISIKFYYLQVMTPIQASSQDLFKVAINKFLSKHPELVSKEIFFLSNGNIVDSNASIESYMSELDKENKEITILVDTHTKVEDKIIDSKEIICPKCKESC